MNGGDHYSVPVQLVLLWKESSSLHDIGPHFISGVVDNKALGCHHMSHAFQVRRILLRHHRATMIFILAILAILAATRASHVGLQSPPVDSLDQLQAPGHSCDNPNGCRSLWDIISSRLSCVPGYGYLCTRTSQVPRIDGRRPPYGAGCGQTIDDNMSYQRCNIHL